MGGQTAKYNFIKILTFRKSSRKLVTDCVNKEIVTPFHPSDVFSPE
jgi:hypothetical protein